MNGLLNIFSRKKRKVYDSIHSLPIMIFNNVIKNNDPTLLVIEGEFKPMELIVVWEKIYSEFIDEFGLSETYLHYIRIKKKWANEMYRVWVKGEKYRQAFAEIHLEESSKLQQSNEDTFTKDIALLSKHMGFRINPHEITVFEYYSYIKSIESNKNG